MGPNPAQVLAFPKIQAIVRDNGTAEVVVAGNSRTVQAADSVQKLRANALAVVVREARTLDRPVRVQIEDPEGHGELIVTPDGDTRSVSYMPKPARRGAAAAGPKKPSAAPAEGKPQPLETAQSATDPARTGPITNIPATVPAPTGTTMTTTAATIALKRKGRHRHGGA